MRLILAMILMLTCSAMAQEKHVLIACPRATWQHANPAKRQAVRNFLERFTDPNAEDSIKPVLYVHTASGTPVFVACFWGEQLKKWRETITEAKIQAIRDALNDANIRIVFTEDPHAQLAEWGLEPSGGMGR